MSIFSLARKTVTGEEPILGRVAHLIRAVIDQYGVAGLRQGYIFIFKSGKTFFSNRNMAPKDLEYTGGYESVPMSEIVEFCERLRFSNDEKLNYQSDDLVYATFLWIRNKRGAFDYYVTDKLFNSFGNYITEWKIDDSITTYDERSNKKLLNISSDRDLILIFSADSRLEAQSTTRKLTSIMNGGRSDFWETMF